MNGEGRQYSWRNSLCNGPGAGTAGRPVWLEVSEWGGRDVGDEIREVDKPKTHQGLGAGLSVRPTIESALGSRAASCPHPSPGAQPRSPHVHYPLNHAGLAWVQRGE